MLLPGFPVTAYREANAPYSLSLELPQEALRQVIHRRAGTLVLPFTESPPTDRVISRFLAKMALEALAHRLLDYPEGVSYLVDEPQLDELRNYARRGQAAEWPHHSRRIYQPEETHHEPDGASYQTVHEFDFLVTPLSEWFFVFALFGLELTINIGGPEIEGYHAWLRENDDASPLYSGKNSKCSDA